MEKYSNNKLYRESLKHIHKKKSQENKLLNEFKITNIQFLMVINSFQVTNYTV